ncbi:hypothetical protein APHAL10511_002305 [Amanita phalloides]|nr:hypothetical protein APHAL10511_002305 [Amanita phalloides]
MANTKAQAVKEKGNAAFKAGDYANAIGHYTEAILADRSDPTLPLNRAAAYLKLGKNEDADRDCTTVLKLSPSNVKALFRRGQARLALGTLLDAQQDLNNALKLEPNNTSVQDVLKTTEQAIATEKSKKSKIKSAPASLAPTSSMSSAPPPKRRRVPIEIVESPSQPQTASDAQSSKAKAIPEPPQTPSPARNPDIQQETMTAISSRSLGDKTLSPFTPSPTSPPPGISQPQPAIPTVPRASSATFVEEKQIRESAKPSRVGGGIFRANGRNTIISPNDKTPATPVPVAQASHKEVRPSQMQGLQTYPGNITAGNETITPSMTMFNFNKAWEANRSVEERWKLVTSISPSSIPTMCKSSLEPALLMSIIDVFIQVVKSNAGDQATVDAVRAYLMGFGGVPRFSTVLLFLSEKEKVKVREAWKLVGVEVLSDVWSPVAR